MIPESPDLPPQLKAKNHATVDAMLDYADRHGDQTLVLDVFRYDRAEPLLPTDTRPWSRVARVRNRILEEVHHFSISEKRPITHLLWIDADITHVPTTMPQELLEVNPGGVSAPMIYVEGSRHAGQFYDWAAFIIHHRSHIQPNNRWNVQGRNLQQNPPFWPTTPPPTAAIMPMDCVGTITLVNIDIYRAGAIYEDHPAFTDHFPICAKARELGRPVTVHRRLGAYHADLPNYGLSWH